ncbi:MAG: response regulator [Luteitalea sp.]|nr:response regulator [Luteitalea sp.]
MCSSICPGLGRDGPPQRGCRAGDPGASPRRPAGAFTPSRSALRRTSRRLRPTGFEGRRPDDEPMTTVRALVVDDEKPARDRLRRLLQRDARVQFVGCSVSGADAIRAVEEAARAGEPVHLLFLDVQMPELDGFGVISTLVHRLENQQVPAVVFVTAYDEYALQAFDAHAVDYLLKPFSDERFEASLDRALRHVRAGHAEALLSQMQALLETIGQPQEPDGVSPSSAHGSAPLDRIVLKGVGRVRLLPVQQITWIEAAGMYVKLHTRDGAAHLHRSLLGQLDAVLDKQRFIRVHRSAIVNIDLIDELQPDAHGDYIVVLKDRTEIRLGRRYRARLQHRLGQGL